MERAFGGGARLGVCYAGGAVGCDCNIWSALVHRGPTDARDRYSNGAGGKDLEHPQAHLGQVIGMVASGVALGLAASVAAAPWIRHLLYGVSASDIRTLSATVLFVMLIAAVATALPAGRAVRIEPGVALRQEN